MILNLRPIPFVYYRLMFLGLLTMTGFVCLGTVMIAEFFGVDLITTATQVEYEAIRMSMTIVGVTCFIFVSSVLFLMQDRRESEADRRQGVRAIEFPERRYTESRRG